MELEGPVGPGLATQTGHQPGRPSRNKEDTFCSLYATAQKAGGILSIKDVAKALLRGLCGQQGQRTGLANASCSQGSSRPLPLTPPTVLPRPLRPPLTALSSLRPPSSAPATALPGPSQLSPYGPAHHCSPRLPHTTPASTGGAHRCSPRLRPPPTPLTTNLVFSSF